MRLHPWFVLLVVSTSGPALAACDELAWKFGMSPADVSAVTACGPYKTFRNGDLETYAGEFEGRKTNFQFFFEAGKLRRIGVYLYEGEDPAAGAKDWQVVRRALRRRFGAVEAPDNPAEGAAFADRAVALVRTKGKTQMAPVEQPKDAFVFSSFTRYEVEGKNYYTVVVNFDAPAAPVAPAKE